MKFIGASQRANYIDRRLINELNCLCYNCNPWRTVVSHVQPAYLLEKMVSTLSICPLNEVTAVLTGKASAVFGVFIRVVSIEVGMLRT